MKPETNITQYVLKEGRDIITSVNMKTERGFLQHQSVSCYRHSLSVACTSVWLVRRFHIPVDMRSMVRGALLHDYFLYDWHTPNDGHRLHGFSHAKKALINARRDFHLNPTEADVIEKHMFPLNIRPPRCRESAIVCMADKICAIREIYGALSHKA